MGKAKWWVCDDCKSLNDLPANKCYKCFTSKPHSPSLIDDQYEHVGGGGEHRVGVTVDLSKVGDLTAPDPVETAEGGLVLEAYGHDDDKPLAHSPEPTGPASSSAPLREPAPPPPLREPERRSISQIASRHWTDAMPSPETATPTPAPKGPPPPSDE